MLNSVKDGIIENKRFKSLSRKN